MHVLERGRRQSGTYNRCCAWWELVVFEHGRRANVLGRVGWGVWGKAGVYVRYLRRDEEAETGVLWLS